MPESAALLVDEVFPKQPARQWVLSFPYPLLFLFASRPAIMGEVLGIVYSAIATHLIKKGIVTLSVFRHTQPMNTRTVRYRRHRFPPEIISYSVWAYHRFALSFRDIEDLLAQRGIIVSYESIRRWCLKFGPRYQWSLKRREGQLCNHWYADEVFVSIQGQIHYLWRAIDQDGSVLDILVQRRRDAKAAKCFFRKVLKGQSEAPRRLFSDKLGSYRVAARELLPGTPHDTRRYANNRVELSHQPPRQQERQMRRFESRHQAHRFLSLHARVNNLFRYGRHLLRAANHRLFRASGFTA